MDLTKEEILATVRPKGYLGIANASAYYDALMTLPDTGRMLEIGTGRGHSTTFFARVKPGWIIYTVDQYRVAAPEFPAGVGLALLDKMVKSWRAQGIFNIVPITANSLEVPWELEVNALYIDGDHSYDVVKSDFERFTPFLKEGGVVLMDDYGIRHRKDINVYEYVESELRGSWKIEPVEGGRGVVLWRKMVKTKY